VVRRPDQVESAQRLEPFVLLTGHPLCLVPVTPESAAVELADDLGAAAFLLVRVYLVAARQAKDAERRPWLVHAEAIADDSADEVVERITARDVPDIPSIHWKPLLAPATATTPSNNLAPARAV
jgi:hypothetical protein